MSGGLTWSNLSLSLTRLYDAAGAFVPPVIPKIFQRMFSDAEHNNERFYSNATHGGQNFFSEYEIEV